MKQENWFVTPIFYEVLDFDTKSIAQKCLQLRNDRVSNRVLSNQGGWQSKDINLNDYEEFSDLSQILYKKVKVLGKMIDPNINLTLDNIWININERGNMNKTHVHPLSAFSGTVYIQVDDQTGKIEFYDDHYQIKHYPLELSNDSVLFKQSVTYTPRNGMLLFFPSWVPHSVEKSESDMPRISISFNLKQLR